MDLKPYQGLDYDGPDDFRRLTMEYIEQVEAVSDYRGTVDDLVFHREAVTLCEATMKYLYTEYTPLETGYSPGSRPVLERVVAKVTDSAMGEREKALALLAWVRDLPDLQPPAREKFHGGTEEEVIEARSSLCGNQARLFAVLAQVAGIPSRIALHYGTPDTRGKMLSGHAVNELYIEGRWAYLDIRGKYFEWPGGRIASTLDLVRFPELTLDQPRRVHAMVREGYALADSLQFFTGRSVTRLCNYFARERERYDFRRFGTVDEEESRRRKDKGRSATGTGNDSIARAQSAIMAEAIEKARKSGLLG